MNINVFISGADVVISAIFAALICRQYLARRKMHQLMWAVAAILWTVGVAAELSATLVGWSAVSYRAYYATGALLIPAWLGMGTLYLVLHRRWANRVFVGLLILSAIGLVLILIWPVDAAQLTSTETQFVPLKVFPFFPVQALLIFLNVAGAGSFVGGALWSVYQFVWRQAIPGRAVATALIAAGGIVAAAAHSLGALGGVELFRISELVALALIFAGFLQSSTVPSHESAPAARPTSA